MQRETQIAALPSGDQDRSRYENSSIQRASLASDRSFEHESVVLLSYILPCQQRLSEGAINRLCHQRAFIIPEDQLRDSLIHAYVQFVYLHLPIINIAEFATALSSKDGSIKVSLLLLQAIFFSATGHLSIDVLTQAAFQSRTAARRIFFDRVKNLYDSVFMVDTINVIQALLYMASWTEDSSFGI
jgi:hypothetical protein